MNVEYGIWNMKYEKNEIPSHHFDRSLAGPDCHVRPDVGHATTISGRRGEVRGHRRDDPDA